MDDLDAKTYDLISGAGMESILMPRKQFVKEHKNLLKVLKSGDPKALKKEYADQKRELEGELKGGVYTKNDAIQDAIAVGTALLKLGDFVFPYKPKDEMLSSQPHTKMKALGWGAMLSPLLHRIQHHINAHPEWKENATEAARRAYEHLTTHGLLTGGDIAEDKRYINSKTPYTLAKEMNEAMLRKYHDDPNVPPSMKEKLATAMEMKGGWTGSKQAGFVRRMMAEAKKKHGGDPYGPNPKIPSYRNPTDPLHPESTMKAPQPFVYSRIQREEDGGENNDEAWGPSPFIVEHFGHGYAGGSASYDTSDTKHPKMIITRDIPIQPNAYYALKNLAHLLDAYSYQPKTRRTDVSRMVHAIARLTADEFMEKVPSAKADIDSHYNFTKKKYDEAYGPMITLYTTVLQPIIQPLAKAKGKSESNYILQDLNPLIKKGTEDTLLGDTLGNLLFSGRGMTGGEGTDDEEEEDAVEKARKREKMLREQRKKSKNSNRAAPPARQVGPTAEERRATEEAERRAREEAEAQRRRDAEAAERLRKLSQLVKKIGTRKVRGFLKGVVAPQILAKRPAKELTEREKKRAKFLEDYFKPGIGGMFYAGTPLNYNEGRLNDDQLARRKAFVDELEYVYKDGTPVQDKDGNYVKDYKYSPALREEILSRGDKLFISPVVWRQRFEEGVADNKTEITKVWDALNKATWKIEGKVRDNRAYLKTPEYLADKEERDRLKFRQMEESSAWHQGNWLRHIQDRYYSRPPHAITLEEARALVGV